MMDNVDRAVWGLHAMRAGTPDFNGNDQRTNGVDAIANILHAVGDPSILDSALMHYNAEVSGDD